MMENRGSESFGKKCHLNLLNFPLNLCKIFFYQDQGQNGVNVTFLKNEEDVD